MTYGRLFLAAVLLLCTPVRLGTAWAQDVGDGTLAISDTLFSDQPKEPVSYMTTYNRDLSSGIWSQSLTYNHNSRRYAFGLSGGSNTNSGLRGLTTSGLTGDLGGNFSFKATNRWLWTLDGRANMNSNEDDRSKTTRRQGRLQLRTQYSFSASPRLTGVGILFGELQQDQSLGSRSIPGQPLVAIDSTAIPPDTTTYQSHTTRDSSFTSGIRDGVSGSIRWTPAAWLDVNGTGAATSISSKTKTLTRDFYAVNPGDGATFVTDNLSDTEAPNGDRRFETRATYSGLRRTSMTVVLRNVDADQEYYALSRRAQEHLSYGTRSGSFHAEVVPLASSQFTVDASVSRDIREYVLQTNLTSLVKAASVTTGFMYSKADARGSLGFQVGRTRNDRQVSQNGTIINRSLNAMAAKKASRRLWIDATGSIGLFSRLYDDQISDRDDVRGSGNVGGGYRVSARCSTTVHFSATRAHAVAIDPSASGGNNVQTTYQMDATLRLQATRSFLILQNYQLNANYQIYDYDELRNTLTRIRRIDTMLSDSLFSFGFIRLTHNFFFQDRGSYTRDEDLGSRTYSVAQELYQQNLSLTVGFRPFQGIVFTATQSLSNSRNYITSPAFDTNRNRWNLNVGATVDRPLPGDMTLQGSVQRIGEYTEMPGALPPVDVVDYWIASAQFSKDF